MIGLNKHKQTRGPAKRDEPRCVQSLKNTATKTLKLTNYLRQDGYACVCSFVRWLVCQQDYTKTAARISIKPERRTGLGAE